MRTAVGPLFLLSGVGVVIAAWWFGRGNTRPPADPPTPPGLVSFAAHPAATMADSRDGWIAQVQVDVHTMTTETLTGTLVHPTMTGALDEARDMAAARRQELADARREVPAA